MRHQISSIQQHIHIYICMCTHTLFFYIYTHTHTYVFVSTREAVRASSTKRPGATFSDTTKWIQRTKLI